MTAIVEFIFEGINDILHLMQSFEFELFGFEINLLYFILASIVIMILVSFLRFGMNIASSEIIHESVGHRLKVNRKNKETDEKSKSRWI